METQTYDLELIAKQMIQARGLEPDFSNEVFKQLNTIVHPASPPSRSEDLRLLLWCSIDNDDSRDLDQLTFAQKEEDGTTTIWVAVADVDALVSKNSAIDGHAKANTTSIYTPAKVFSMLPEKLSTNLTSLNENEDRVALISKMKINQKGEIGESSIFQGLVHNYAKLTYHGVGSWLEGKAPIPQKIGQIPGLEKALRCQHEAAQLMKLKHQAQGSLILESPEVEFKMVNHQGVLANPPLYNYSNQLIEQFMIAANTSMAQHLRKLNIASLRRIVRVPKRWDRIVEIAMALGETLPIDPHSKALEEFLLKRKKADPVAFPDLSLAIIKLLGRGEYIVETAQDKPVGHFGLALPEYMHSTAPNRRFPDLIAQRQYKAYLNRKKAPYSLAELQALALHCTEQEDRVIKVERQMNKVAAAILLSSHVGEMFAGIITGTGEKGTWVRIFSPPIEGKVIKGLKDVDVGDRVKVKLVGVDIPQGFINFSSQR